MKFLRAYLFLISLISGTLLAQNGRTYQGYLQIDGIKRTFSYYKPSSLTPGKKYPLVLVLHGGGGTGKQIARFTQFNRLADIEHFTPVYPNGYQKGWNDGRIAPAKPAYNENLNDVKFLSKLIDHFISYDQADPERVFSTGISNGGFMSVRLAHEIPEKLLAVAPITATMGSNWAPAFDPKGVSALIINGTDDPLVPYEGGFVMNNPKRGHIVSTDELVNAWKNALDCGEDNTGTLGLFYDEDQEDGAIANFVHYSCNESTQLQVITVQGGGHTWPGAAQYLPKRIVGNVCNDFDATSIIWDFFNSCKLHE